MKIACLYQGGHIHTWDVGDQQSIFSDLVSALEERESSVYIVWDDTGEHQIGAIILDHLQQLWIVD